MRFKSCDTCLCACAFQQQARDPRTACPGGGVWVAVTREFERDNCVISEILQSDWTIPNRAGVPRKSTKVPRPSFRVWAGRSGHETTARRTRSAVCLHTAGISLFPSRVTSLESCNLIGSNRFLPVAAGVPRPYFSRERMRVRKIGDYATLVVINRA